MWANPPAAVSTMRDMLVASTTYAAEFGGEGTVHYPRFAAGETPSDEPLPCSLIVPVAVQRTAFATGVSLPGGTLAVHLVAPATTDDLEHVAAQIAEELAQQATGLPIIDASASLGSAVTAAASAAQEDAVIGVNSAFRSIVITVTYGLRD